MVLIIDINIVITAMLIFMTHTLLWYYARRQSIEKLKVEKNSLIGAKPG